MQIHIDTKSHPNKVLISFSGRKSVLRLNSADITVLRLRHPGATIFLNGQLNTYGLQ